MMNIINVNPLTGFIRTTPLTKTTTVQNEVALRYHTVCGLYFLVVVFMATIIL